jgi:uncharacterized protein YndB with AHSA1/START domain
MSVKDAPQVVRKSIRVGCEPAAAFRILTEQVRVWWPAGHSLSGDPHTQVYIEAGVNGRFYERTSNGDEYEWGRVLLWEPPQRLICSWYLGSSQELPTEVEVTFTSLSAKETEVEVVHRGSDLLGDLWWQRVNIFNNSWEKLLGCFQGRCAKAGAEKE